jgi:phenylalanyl-tRNA synthetase beta chain
VKVPQSTLSANRVLELLRPKPSRSELEGLLWQSKAELSDWQEDDLVIEVTPDRLDLLSEGGLAAFLEGLLGTRRGPIPLTTATAPPSETSARVEESVRPLRPFLSGAILSAPSGVSLDAGLLAEAIRFQEILHATIGFDRRAASLGIYPIERLTPPFRYALEPLPAVRFVPLDQTEEISASRFFAEHPMAVRYGPLARVGEQCLTLRDARGRVLSVPPVLNSRDAGEVRIGDRALFLESTGTREGRVEESVGLLLLPFVARGWSAQPLRVDYPDRPDSGRSVTTARRLLLLAKTLEEIVGSSLAPEKVAECLGTARLGAVRAPEGWWVDVPPWRPDLQSSVDLAEEVLVARGIGPKDGLLPPSVTRGRRLPETHFRSRVRALLLGLGFAELRTTVLVPDRLAALLDRSGAIALLNPVSELFGRLRDSLQISLLGSLERNLRTGYPQRISDVGPIVVPDSREASGGSTHVHAGIAVASERAGFADAAAVVDYVLSAFGARGVREPATLPGTIPGRAARLRVAGEPVAEMGEIAPAVLAALHLPVPVVWSEIDLTVLWPLVRASE